MKIIVLMLLSFSSITFAGVDSGTGGGDSSNECEFIIMGVDSGTGGKSVGGGVDSGTGGGKSTDTGTGRGHDNGTGNEYMLYLECVNQNRNLKWVD